MKKIIIALLIISVLTLLHNFNENEIKNCMEAGFSENFCRYAGE